MSLVLVGFPRTGKSYFGRLLAELLKVPFFDTDELIKKEVGEDAAILHAKLGEERFRQIEKEILHTIAFSSRAILATGGGLPCDEENREYLRTLGKVVFLSLPERDLWMALCRGRWPSFLDPLHPVTSFKKLYQERYPLYERCSTDLIRLQGLEEGKVLRRLEEIFERQLIPLV